MLILALLALHGCLKVTSALWQFHGDNVTLILDLSKSKSCDLFAYSDSILWTCRGNVLLRLHYLFVCLHVGDSR